MLGEQFYSDADLKKDLVWKLHYYTSTYACEYRNATTKYVGNIYNIITKTDIYFKYFKYVYFIKRSVLLGMFSNFIFEKILGT